MSLTDTAVRNAKPGAKQQKLYDERGLFLLIAPNGGKWWRFKYRFGGKEKLLSLGTYPDVSLKDARQQREQVRALIANGIDPSHNRKAAKQSQAGADSFEAVAREWFANYEPTWAVNHANRIIRRLERDIFPWIGSQPISTIMCFRVCAAIAAP